MTTLTDLTLRCIFCFCVAYAYVANPTDLATKYNSQSREQNDFRRTANDKLAEMGSANEASDVSNKISQLRDRINTRNQLNGVQRVLNNYVSLMGGNGEAREQTGKAASVQDEMNGTTTKHTLPSNGLNTAKNSAGKSKDFIKNPITKQRLNPEISKNSKKLTYKNKRSVKLAKDYTPTRRRQQRGVRSSVADRIAHGFGKRAYGANLELLFDPVDQEAVTMAPLIDSRGQGESLDDFFEDLPRVYQENREAEKQNRYSE